MTPGKYVRANIRRLTIDLTPDEHEALRKFVASRPGLTMRGVVRFALSKVGATPPMFKKKETEEKGDGK